MLKRPQLIEIECHDDGSSFATVLGFPKLFTVEEGTERTAN